MHNDVINSLIWISYILPMPVMLKIFGHNSMVDKDTDEPAGVSAEYGIGPVLMMLFWLPTLVVTYLFIITNFIVGIVDTNSVNKKVAAMNQYLKDVW